MRHYTCSFRLKEERVFSVEIRVGKMEFQAVTRLLENGILTITNTGAYNIEVMSMPVNAITKPHNEEIARLLERGVYGVVQGLFCKYAWVLLKC